VLAAGFEVRALVRDVNKASALGKDGAELIRGEIGSRADLSRFLAGARSAYLLLPPNLSAKDVLSAASALTGTIAASLEESGIEHVTLLSSIAAHRPSGTGPILTVRGAEDALRRVIRNRTFLRAAYFMENVASVLPVVKAEGIFPTFVSPDITFEMVSTEDIGRSAAAAMFERHPGERIIELAGPRPFSQREVAATLGRILKREIRVVHAGLEAVEPTMMQMGMSADLARLYRELLESLESRTLLFEHPTTAFRGLTSLESALRRLLGS
jgi:uncharacterized protein YbjT (DUF2867 family)